MLLRRRYIPEVVLERETNESEGWKVHDRVFSLIDTFYATETDFCNSVAISTCRNPHLRFV